MRDPVQVEPRPFGTLLALAAVAALFLLHGVYDRLAFYDEGIVLAGAERVLEGEAPYVDFWTIYPPGQFYLVALVFGIFGKSMLVERLFDLAVRVLLCLVAYRLVRDLSTRRHALGTFAMMLVWLGYSRYSAYPTYPALLAVLLGVGWLLRHLERQRPGWLYAAAASVVVAVLFRHDVGAMAGLAFAAVLALDRRWRSLARYCVVGLAAAVAVGALFQAAFGLDRVLRHLLEVPYRVFAEYRWVPYPDSSTKGFLAFYIFPAAVIAGLATTALAVVRRRFDAPTMWGVGALSLFGGLTLLLLRVRSDTVHLLPCAVVAVMLAPLLLAAWTSGPAGSRVARRVLAVGVSAVMAFALGYALEAQWEMALRIARGQGGVPQGLREAATWIRRNTDPTDAVYSGVTNHDQFVVNGVALNFLARRPYATRYHELHPGLTNTAPVQREIVAELERAEPRVALLATHNWTEPNESSVDTGVDLLDRYIRSNYRYSETFGLFELWVRDPTPDS